MLKIRKSTIEDLAVITEIYNDAILTTTATFDVQLKNLEEQKIWYSSHGSKYPILVAEQNGHVVGWASLSRWSDRCAYSDTAEISLYVSKEYRGKGIGKKLLQTIIHEGRLTGLHTIIARITEGNEVSVHLHESAGFEHIGTMKEVGKKFNKFLNVYLMQLIYNH